MLLQRINTKKYCFILALLIICSNAFSAVAYVESFYNASGGGDPTTISLTISAATNGILLVTTQGKEENENVTISAVTWNGDSLTKLTTATDTWYILNPDAGTYNLVVTHGSAYNMYTVATLYSGVEQNAPAVESKGSGTTPGGESYNNAVTDAVTSLTANSMIYAVGNNHSNKRYYSTNGYTLRSPSGLASGTVTSARFITMDLEKAVAGESTFEYNVEDPSRTWEIDLVVLEPVVASRNRLMIIQ